MTTARRNRKGEHGIDELSLTRVVSVVAQPREDDWACKVDFDTWISPWEACALLKAGYLRMHNKLYGEAPEDVEEDPE